MAKADMSPGSSIMHVSSCNRRCMLLSLVTHGKFLNKNKNQKKEKHSNLASNKRICSTRMWQHGSINYIAAPLNCHGLDEMIIDACLLSFSRSLYLKLQILVLQVAIVRPILFFVAGVLWANGNYTPGVVSLTLHTFIRMQMSSSSALNEATVPYILLCHVSCS